MCIFYKGIKMRTGITKKQHKLATFALLVIMLLIAAYIRLQGTSYDITALKGTDSVRYVHQAKQIAEAGYMPKIDKFRYAPLGRRTANQLTVYPYTIAAIYRLINLSGVDCKIEYIAIVLPVAFFILTALTIYILVWHVFDNYTALLSVNIAILAPPVVVKTASGSADRDSIVLLLSTVSFLFYILSHLSNFDGKRWFFRSMSTFFMLLTVLTWRGAGIFIFIIVTVEFIRLLLDYSYSFRESGLLACWVLPISLGAIILKPDVYRHFAQPHVFVAIIYPLLILFVSVLVSVIQHVKVMKKLLSFHNRLPIGMILTLLSGSVFFALTYVIGTGDLIDTLIERFISPFGTDPLFQTIDELQKLGALGWSLYPGVFFIPMAVGLLLIVRDICKYLDLHQYWTMSFVEIIIFGVAFSRLFSDASMASFTENSVTLTIYWASIGIGVFGLISGTTHAYFRRNIDNPIVITRVIWVKIFLALWCIFMLMLFRSAIRFAFLFVIPSTILGSYTIIWILKRCIQKRKLSLIYILYAGSILWQVYALFSSRMNWHYIHVSVYILLTALLIFTILLFIKYILRPNILYKLGLVV
ncbi:hypothetical protein GF312_10750 [Candidatus Poribacteria bacterium]|nr:hypothetical protein [Candidatus Poribacteria bacterium]